MTLNEDTILEGRYRIDSLITQNRTGATYRGFDAHLNTPVIIKEKNLQTSQAINQFKQEALILTGLRHLALPGVIRHFSFAGQQYLVMDFVPGESLWEFMEKSERPYPERYALQYILQICQPLAYLHQQNPPLIHRDIKPHNIRFSPTGKAMLVDFGIAKEFDTADPLSVFVAPEHLQGQQLSPASDIYALGATLYTLITGKMPSPHPTATKEFDPFAESNPTLTQKTAQAIAQALHFNPAERPQQVTLWQKELQTALDLVDSSATPKNTLVAVSLPDQSQITNKPAQTDRTQPNFWLVDSTGLGYPITPEALIIGGHPEANIRIEDLGVDPFHAQLRQDGPRCLIMDESSEHGTLLNSHRLGSGWYPFEPGDILIIGPTRFHLTTTKPVKIGSIQPQPKSTLPQTPDLEPVAAVQPATDEPPASPQEKRAIPLPLLLLAGLLLLSSIGGLVYFFFIPQRTQTLSGEQTTPSQSAAAVVTQTESESENVSPLTSAAKTTPLPVAEEAAVLEDAPESRVTVITSDDMTPTTTVTPVENIIVVEETAPTASTPTQTPSPSTATQATPTPTGPTVIPLDSDETIDKIGAREVIDVDLNPKNPREVYALVKKDGLYKSNKGGDGPWLKMPVDALGVVAFVIDPTNSARFYAPTWNAILKSSDGGNTWTANTNGLLGNKTVDTVTINPVNPNILYAGVGENLVVSTDGGQMWSSQGYGQRLGVAKIHSIVVDPFAPETIYVAGLAGSIYKSEDGGVTFSQLPDNIGQGAFSMVVHPTQRDVYLVGINSATAGIIKTEDGFGFSPVSSGLVYGGADSPYNTIVYAPSNPNIVYAGSGDEDNQLAKGIFKSTNGGEQWVQISDDLPRNPDTRQPYYVKSLAVHPTNSNIVFAATGGGLYQSVDGGTSWVLR